MELNKILKVGALGVIVTAQAWPLHDQPWDFWRYSDSTWRALFNVKTGFEIIEARMREPAFLVPQTIHAGVDHLNAPIYQSATVAFRKIGETSLSWNVSVLEITDTTYPAGELPFISKTR